jgi:putative transcriptional regulator
MSKTTTIARRRPDGTLVEVLDDGTERPFPDDDLPMPEMTEEEVHAAAMSDPDARPMTKEERRNARRVPRAKTLRRALHLDQEEFASRFHLPLVMLIDWEEGCCEADQIALTYLWVIARNTQAVERALQTYEAERPPTPASFIRCAFQLTREEFASRFRIPLETLIEWEEERSEPDQVAQAYLWVIANDAGAVERALQPMLSPV